MPGPTSTRRPVAAAAVALATALSLAACSSSTTPPATPPANSCDVLFGTPIAQTGLTAEQCQPSCSCGGTTWTPPTYDAAFVAGLVSGWTLTNPLPPLSSDPYAVGAAQDDVPDWVCGVLPGEAIAAGPRPYRLETYTSEASARAAGARPTHFGRCGVCSSLANLAVYVRENDLGSLVRQCGLQNPGFDGDVACLQRLGFDLPCAQIWAYNTANTSRLCLEPCLQLLTAKYQLPDGSLNACLACDETRSGPVFKAVAGRTRRNSGLPNAICRPCSEVRPLEHAY